MAAGYLAMNLPGNALTYDAAAPIDATGIATATTGNQTLLLWNPGDANIDATAQLANAGSLGQCGRSHARQRRDQQRWQRDTSSR